MPTEEGGRLVEARDSVRKWAAMALLLLAVGHRYGVLVEGEKESWLFVSNESTLAFLPLAGSGRKLLLRPLGTSNEHAEHVRPWDQAAPRR